MAAGNNASAATWAPDLLILDDFANELVSRRYRRGSLILTTNREPKDLYALFPNPFLAEGLLDRLVNSAFVLTLLGQLPAATAPHHPRRRPAVGR